MEPVVFFDSNVCFGPARQNVPWAAESAERAVSLMRRRGIAKALVTHTLQSEYHPAYANRLLIDEIAGHGNLYPVWALLPHHTGEFPPPGALREQLKQNDIRAVKLFPSLRHHNFPFEEYCCGELLEMLADAKAPLLLDLEEVGWRQLDETCGNHGNLRVILMNLNYSVDRALYPLLERHANLYVESSGYKQYRGVEFFVRRFGAHRMVFGSGLPAASVEAAVSTILYADIDEDARRRIAGENLQKLIDEVAW